MLIKRLVVALVSIVSGFLATYIIVTLVGTNLEEYGATYTFFTALSLGCVVAIWLDKFMETGLLPK